MCERPWRGPGITRPLYKETDIVPNDYCRICRIYLKVSGRSKINFFGYNNKDFSQTLSSVLSAVYQREVVKFARVYQSRLLHCLLLRGAPFALIRGHSLQNSNINMYYYQYTRPNRKSASSKHTLSGPQKTDSGLLQPSVDAGKPFICETPVLNCSFFSRRIVFERKLK